MVLDVSWFAVAGWITDNYKMLDGSIGKWYGLFLQGSHSSYLLFALLFDSE
jgi:hypothetical protein